MSDKKQATSDKTSDYLLPCPFCGGEAIYETKRENELGTIIPQMFCNSCKMTFEIENDSPFLNDDKTYDYLKGKLNDLWNTRKPVDEVLDRLENAAFWTPQTYDEDGFGNDDSEEVVLLDRVLEIVKEELN